MAPCRPCQGRRDGLPVYQGPRVAGSEHPSTGPGGGLLHPRYPVQSSWPSNSEVWGCGRGTQPPASIPASLRSPVADRATVNGGSPRRPRSPSSTRSRSRGRAGPQISRPGGCRRCNPGPSWRTGQNRAPPWPGPLRPHRSSIPRKKPGAGGARRPPRPRDDVRPGQASWRSRRGNDQRPGRHSRLRTTSRTAPGEVNAVASDAGVASETAACFSSYQ